MALAIAALLVALVAGLVVYVSSRPAAFRIERSAVVGAPADVVFPLINDFHQWGRWSPWEKLDPVMTKTFEGAPYGPGSVYSWTGNNKVGKGRMTIEDSTADRLVSIKLEFMKPFKATNRTVFSLTPDGGATTRVTWAMDGRNNFMTKAFGLVMNMDAVIGKDFEAGLANLNAAVQGGSPRPSHAPLDAAGTARRS